MLIYEGNGFKVFHTRTCSGKHMIDVVKKDGDAGFYAVRPNLKDAFDDMWEWNFSWVETPPHLKQKIWELCCESNL